MKINRIPGSLLILIFFTFFLALSSCTVQHEPQPISIGISKALPEEYYGNYAKWLNTADTSIVCIDLYHMPLDSALLKLASCSGLLISGGQDVDPGRYGQDGDTVKCGTIDFYRDTLEWSLITMAKEMEMPILGICRGLQIFNIYHDGSLYPDLPTDFDTTVVHRCKDTYVCDHSVRVLKKSGLFIISGQGRGTVNSNHHQGIHRLGSGLAAAARTEDGLIESIEYEDRKNMPFFLGVQWHPERMDLQNPFSLPIATYFIQEAKLFNINKQ
jgi:putative glutamine amidotransferase